MQGVWLTSLIDCLPGREISTSRTDLMPDYAR